ncbi:hypothetical protein [Nannocystis radixulma]|uniref:Uncharacterized protein n=1 Tax=Nannocystis radixulma TaxID=2995305 RepID=A0ABT5AZV0_9BACT|nr:hypothetical protein [Nannocystis radixulma]MDC0667370.1 hypothetical protein [Nannocystis radixulma]
MRHLFSKCGDGVCYCWQWGIEGRLKAIGFPHSDDPESQARDDAALARQRESIIYAFTGSWRLSEEAAALPPEVLRSLQEQALAKARMDWPSREPSQWTTRIVSVSTSRERVSATVEVWDGDQEIRTAYVDHPPRPPRRRPSWYL